MLSFHDVVFTLLNKQPHLLTSTLDVKSSCQSGLARIERASKREPAVMSSSRQAGDSSGKKGSVLTIKSSEKEPRSREQMSAKSKFNRHLLQQTQARQQSQDQSVAQERWKILKEVFLLLLFDDSLLLFDICKAIKEHK